MRMIEQFQARSDAGKLYTILRQRDDGDSDRATGDRGSAADAAPREWYQTDTGEHVQPTIDGAFEIAVTTQRDAIRVTRVA